MSAGRSINTGPRLPMSSTLLAVLPPFLSIALALVTKRIIPSLAAGIAAGILIVAFAAQQSAAGYGVFVIRETLLNSDHIRIFLFSLLMGAFVCLLRRSESIDAFLAWVIRRRLVRSARGAGFFAFFMGTCMFLEGSLSILSVGTVAKPLFRKFRICNEKLAYICDASCAPIAVLLPLNGWGAYLILQFQSQGVAEPVQLLIQSLPYFIYPWVAVMLCLVAIGFDWNPGFMKRCHDEAEWAGEIDALAEPGQPAHKRPVFLFWLPVAVMILTAFAAMWVTGKGSLIAGDGARSVLASVVAAVALCYALYLPLGIMTLKGALKATVDGIRELGGIVFILFLAFLLNRVCRDLETGNRLAAMIHGQFPSALLPGVIFLLSAVMAFATGTSWGTFAVMISVVLPMASAMQLPLPLVVGAIVSGGVWGDHCSPVSDTTVLSALASGSDVMRHVKSQMPYALIGAALSFTVFGVLGFMA